MIAFVLKMMSTLSIKITNTFSDYYWSYRGYDKTPKRIYKQARFYEY
jgi:hypothetical protein